jgi:hypothetical protein
MNCDALRTEKDKLHEQVEGLFVCSTALLAWQLRKQP